MILGEESKQSVWTKHGNSLFPQELVDKDSVIHTLESRVYEIKSFKDNLYLEPKEHKFTFNYKIYGLRQGFIDKFIRTFENTDGNLGALFNGIKGTGKTIMAKQIANKLNLPVILVTNSFEGKVVEFLSKNFKQDIVVLIDEFEKTFEGGGEELLTLMDGVLSDSNYRKVFLLTSNKLHINENLIERPGRIRYLVEFSNLEENEVREVIDDCLYDDCLQFKEEIIDITKTLKIITIDNIKQIVNEVNIHKISPNELIKDMNISSSYNKYNIYVVDGGVKKLIRRNYNEFDDGFIGIGTYLYRIGRVLEFKQNNRLLVNIHNNQDDVLSELDYEKSRELVKNANINIDSYTSYENLVEIFGKEDVDKYFAVEIEIEKVEKIHESFQKDRIYL